MRSMIWQTAVTLCLLLANASFERGWSRAGYTEAEIKPLFKNAPSNCEFEWLT